MIHEGNCPGSSKIYDQKRRVNFSHKETKVLILKIGFGLISDWIWLLSKIKKWCRNSVFSEVWERVEIVM